MQLIAEPDALSQSSWLMAGYEFFGFEDLRQMLIYFGIGIFILLAFTNGFGIFTAWLQYKYSWGIAHNLSVRLLKTYLDKPYKYYLTTNTADLRTYIISEVNSLTGGVIIPIIELFSRAFVSIIIFVLLLKVDAKIALIMFGGLGSCYGLIYLSQKNFLKRVGEHRINMNLLRFKSLQELLDGIKTVMVYNQQDFFYDRFHYASNEFCNVQPKYNLVLAAPRYILEFMAFGSILIITIYLYINSGNIQSAIPRLSLYAVAGYRLLPALQKAFAAAAKLRHNFPVLHNLHDDLVFSLKYTDQVSPPIVPMELNHSIELDHLQFAYDNMDSNVIKNLNLQIEKGQTVAFIGSTGSGKTTLVDLVVGLLHPSEGGINIDGIPIAKENTKSWRANLAYVPQEVFLFDDTVLRNIVMGEKEEDIDLERLERITKMAGIFNFIEKQLPKKFQTGIGERGVRLSGGQRQRLGLARALYSNPSVLILDEATSALDSITEKSIIESLKSLPKDITTIIVAHRLSTIKHADCIFVLDQGKILTQGTYETLILTDDKFKTMVELS